MKNKDYTGYEDQYIKVLRKSNDSIQKEKNKNKVKIGVYYDTICKRCGKEYPLVDSNIGKVKSCGCYMRTKWKDTIDSHIGEKFGSLTIIGSDIERTEKERNDKNTKICDNYYFTKCDCGTVLNHSTRYNSLKTGHIKSCGCSKFNNPLIYEDLTGQKFNRLTVVCRDIERDRKRIDNGTKGGNAHWLCKCDCGNPIISKSENNCEFSCLDNNDNYHSVKLIKTQQENNK